MTGAQYDANGNLTAVSGASYTYDAENRMSAVAVVGDGGATYGYDSQNKRIMNWTGSTDQNGNASGYTIYYYGVKGERLGVYNFTVGYYGTTPTLQNTTTSTETYFGARRLSPLDRLGSARRVNGSTASYYPFGEDKSTNATVDAWKFGTYWSDSISGLDYAVNRYYSSALGRFLTPDRYAASAVTSAPQSWNRYGYTSGDPVSRRDPSGLYDCDPDDPDCSTGCDPDDDPGCTSGCNPDDPSCGLGSSPVGPKGVPPPSPTTVPCNSTVESLAGALGGTAACEVGFGPAVQLFTTLSDLNSFLEGLGLPEVAGVGATGGVVTIGGVVIGWGEIGAGAVATITSPEVVISIGLVAGAAALYEYYQQRHQPCVPPSGTKCYQLDTGRPHNGWENHYHIWTQNQNPTTGRCYWNRGHGTDGATQFPPPGMQDCSTYPSWPFN